VLDLGIDLDVWPWIWMTIAVIFALIELTVLAGSFVLLPFAVSAFAAGIAGFYDASVEVQWMIFAIGGGIAWILMYRWAKRFVTDNQLAPGVGSERLIGLDAIVTTAIDPADTARRGRVSVAGETWGALTEGRERVADGARVRVTAVVGTRVVVEPIAVDGFRASPPTSPPITPFDPPAEGTS
jgi:membrane protein implicated in regulation of membrane protease activity